MAKRKVTQDDLRKMMAEVKKAAPAPSANKKYKLSSREMLLLEEQRKEDERKKAKEREKKAAALAALPAPDAVPAKSILKNKSAPVFISTYKPPPQPVNVAATTTSSSASALKDDTDSKSSSEASSSSAMRQQSVTAPETNEVEDKSGTLPEGFFDDPVLDAKARHVQYVDTAEEEWDRFQKEIVDEMNIAQDILVEDRIEATVDRQIEEIDEQMRAWTRVAEMEKLKDEQVKKVHSIPVEPKQTSKDESDDEESNFEEFFDWRKKK